ncbi:tetratricopeptide repeat protein [Sphingomonas sp. URHD0057]|uniref:tetratricopeptide repeat protein n=1 Tax=Sphingomonas sp. URHD0057 TaxID=1380389 RepID=UPI0006847726|nr:tetratricopeptide repeat protein [Sphingomonas sp. URHD0057]
MGWAILLLLIAAAFGALWASGVRGGLLTAALAVMMLGASGYALQGRPTLAGSPAKGSEGQQVQLLTEARHAFFGNFSADESWLRISEALASHGNTEDAVNILQNAVRRYPADGQLWIGLGNALVDHGHGLTPPAEFAYRRAAALLPAGHPAPRFFHDLALLRSGGGEPAFRDLIALMREHPDASWRPMVGNLVMAIAFDGGGYSRQQR